MTKSLKKLRQDEKAAVKEYGAKAAEVSKKGDKVAAKKIKHIQGEEKEHARELTVLIRKRGSHSATQHPVTEEE